jgi:uncharacterized LabA/DUF88 family protein
VRAGIFLDLDHLGAAAASGMWDGRRYRVRYDRLLSALREALGAAGAEAAVAAAYLSADPDDPGSRGFLDLLAHLGLTVRTLPPGGRRRAEALRVRMALDVARAAARQDLGLVVLGTGDGAMAPLGEDLVAEGRTVWVVTGLGALAAGLRRLAARILWLHELQALEPGEEEGPPPGPLERAARRLAAAAAAFGRRASGAFRLSRLMEAYPSLAAEEGLRRAGGAAAVAAAALAAGLLPGWRLVRRPPHELWLAPPGAALPEGMVPEDPVERAVQGLSRLPDPARLAAALAAIRGEDPAGELAAAAGISRETAWQILRRLAAEGVPADPPAAAAWLAAERGRRLAERLGEERPAFRRALLGS